MPSSKISLEDSILNRELSLETIFNAFTDGVYDYNIKNKLTSVSDNFYRILGYEPGEFEITDERWDALIHPDDLKFASSLFYDHLEGKIPRYVAEYRMIRKDGNYQWISCTGQLVGKDKEGKPLRVIGAIKSIHSKKQLEFGMKTLIHTASTLRGMDFFKYMARSMADLFQVNHVIICTTNDQKPSKLEPLVMWVHGSFKKYVQLEITGTPSEQVYEKKERVFIYGDLVKEFPEDAYIQEHQIFGYYGVPLYGPSNEIVGHMCLMTEKEGVVRQWMEAMIELFAQSIGSEVERIKNEEELHKLNKLLDRQVKERTIQLEKAVEDLDSFFYKASHDLRAPITTLEGIYNLLESEIDSEEKQRLFKLLGSQIISIKKLNRSIIEVGNIRNHLFEPKQISLELLLKELIQGLTLPKGFHIEKAIDYSLEVYTDEYLLSTLLIEFISNSINHRDIEKSKCFVRIEIVQSNGTIDLAIIDNGTGISDRFERDYFKLFLRASTTSSGFGLGLYKAKLAADKAGIELSITSQEQKGTEIRLTIPIKA